MPFRTPTELIHAFDKARTDRDEREIERLTTLIMTMLVRIAKSKTQHDLWATTDIIENGVGAATYALLEPNTPNGRLLRENAQSLVTNRTVDAYRLWRARKPLVSIDDEREAEIANLASNWTPLDDLELSNAVSRALETLPVRLHAELRKMVAGKPAGDRQSRRDREKVREHFRGEISKEFVTGLGGDYLDQHSRSNTMAANPSLHDVAMTAFQIGGGLAPSDAEVARWCKAFPEFAEDFEMAAHLARGDFDYLEQRDTDHDHTSWLVEKYVTNLMKRITAGWDANVTP